MNFMMAPWQILFVVLKWAEVHGIPAADTMARKVSAVYCWI
jgi:hypothetical protein